MKQGNPNKKTGIIGIIAAPQRIADKFQCESFPSENDESATKEKKEPPDKSVR